MNEPRTRVGDLGDTPWWATVPTAAAALSATACAALGQSVSNQALLWLVVVAAMSIGVAWSRRARVADQHPAIDRRATPQGTHGTGWWLLLHITMIGAGAAPFMWLALQGNGGPDGMALVGVTASAIGLLFGTRSGLTISLACSAGALALALGRHSGSTGWWFNAGIPVWLPWVSVVCILLGCAMVARLGLAELATVPNVPAPFSTPVTDRRGEGLFRTPSRSAMTAAALVTGLCVGMAAILEPFVSPTTQRLSEATADRITQATGGAGGDLGRGAGASVFRGAGRGAGSSNVLGASDSFAIDDFGATSDEEVLRVELTFARDRFAGGGAARTDVLLKGQSFDTWDGRSWFSSAEVVRALASGEATFSARADPNRSADLFVTRVQVRKGSTNLVFGPSRIAEVDFASQSLRLKDDEAVVSDREMGPGSQYTVISARHPQRDSAPDVPIATLAQSVDELTAYGVRPEHFDASALSERSRNLAVEVAGQATTIQGVVRNIDTWLGTNTVYDYRARQRAGDGSDVVDDFLFRSRAGWCEQIATAAVMMLRANGIPARLATGYLPSTVRADGSFSVLGRDAHAWVEYYVPGYGWAERDPTRAVPVSKLPPPPAPEQSRQRSLSALVLLAAAVLAVGVSVIVLRRVRRPGRSSSPVDRAIRELEAFGSRHHVRRAPGQTLTEFAAVLDAQLDAQLDAGLAGGLAADSEQQPTPPSSARTGPGLDVGAPHRAHTVVALLERERFDPSADGDGVNQAVQLIHELSQAHPSRSEPHDAKNTGK